MIFTRLVGVDFGTRKTLVATWDAETSTPRLVRLRPEAGGDDMPTTVHVDVDGKMTFGDEAELLGSQDSEGLRDHFKRDLNGEAPPYLLHSYNHTAADLTREYLGWLRCLLEANHLEGEIEHVVLTVPATWLPAARARLYEAAAAAGFRSVEILDEPVAAGLAFLRGRQDLWQEGALVVFDWGAGTLDLAVLTLDGGEPRVSTNLIGGRGTLGGQDIDFDLLQAVNQRLAQLKLRKLERRTPEEKEHVRRRVREWKIALADNPTAIWRMDGLLDDANGVDLTWTGEQLQARINGKIGEAIEICGQLIERAYADGIAPAGILLVGGSSHFPALREMLQARFTDITVLPWEQRESAVALGAAYHAAGQAAQPVARTGLAIQQFADAANNPLGSKFIPVRVTKGTAFLRSVYFAEHPVRVRDYARFAAETGRVLSKPGFDQSPDDPVVNVHWHDAVAFCEWLSQQCREEGMCFRLPTDHEWSCAVGIGELEDPSGDPKTKGEDPRLRNIFPWGSYWPPATGNYCGEEHFPRTDLWKEFERANLAAIACLDAKNSGAWIQAPAGLIGAIIVTAFFGSCTRSCAYQEMDWQWSHPFATVAEQAARRDAGLSWAGFWFGSAQFLAIILLLGVCAYLVLVIKLFRYSPARIKPGIPGYHSGHQSTSPMGSYRETETGLYDLGGNVWEWTQDTWPKSGNEKVLRGGSWREYRPERIFSACREHKSETTRQDDVGFRCVIEVAKR